MPKYSKKKMPFQAMSNSSRPLTGGDTNMWNGGMNNIQAKPFQNVPVGMPQQPSGISKSSLGTSEMSLGTSQMPSTMPSTMTQTNQETSTNLPITKANAVTKAPPVTDTPPGMPRLPVVPGTRELDPEFDALLTDIAASRGLGLRRGMTPLQGVESIAGTYNSNPQEPLLVRPDVRRFVANQTVPRIQNGQPIGSPRVVRLIRGLGAPQSGTRADYINALRRYIR